MVMHGCLAFVTLATLASLIHPVLLNPTSVTNRRKTLAFGPNLPHARFNSIDLCVTPAVVNSTKDTYAVVHEFLSSYNDTQAGHAYIIRPDSYIDHATGVTHVYASQVIGGIEVANGHVNLNIKNGRVLSFGDSFFPGKPDQYPHVPARSHSHYCGQLSSLLDIHRSLIQSLASCDRARIALGLDDLEHFYVSNCADVPPSIANEIDIDPRRPVLAFLAFALLENHPKFNSFQDRLDEHLSNIIMIPETHLLGEYASLSMLLSNVPGTVSDVKARIVWVQIPTEHGIKLELAHRFEVEMEHNWYETTVTTSIPHRVISVVDWVSDVAMPAPVAMGATTGQPPKLGGVFVPPGTTFELKASAPLQEFSKAISERKGVPQLPEVNRASYLVFPWGTNDPVEAAQRKAERSGKAPTAEYPLSYGREVMEELGDTLASPTGWHTLPVSRDPGISEEDRTAFGDSYWRTTRTTWGNNVFVHENWRGQDAWMYNERPLGTDRVFSYSYAPAPMSTEFESLEQAKAHINASVTQLFYTSNMIHDLFYRYGFTEAAGNFQQYNFGRGGEEGDGIIADAQIGDAYNNAEFASPPDGVNGRCRITLWNTNSPYPDGAMDAGVIIHELSHGLSARLTGGPKNAGCLNWGEARGMAEGWGDFIAVSAHSTSTYSDYGIAAWAANREGGIRHYPYSIDFLVNPMTYETLNKPELSGIRALGELWAEMLWVIQQHFIAKHGFSDTLFPPAPKDDGTLPLNDFYRPQTFDQTGSPNPLVPKHGNTLFLQLVINGMKMQPCSPSFFDARAAIIDADKVLTGGENVCVIWRGFAERGLGLDATVVGSTPGGGGLRKNGFQVPTECRSGEPESLSESEPIGQSGDHELFSLWYTFKRCIGKWISKLLWSY